MPKDKLAAEAEAIDGVALAFDPDPFLARGDCRDIMLQVLRTTADWSKFSEQQQRDINASVDQAAETIIAKLVRAIAAEGREAVRAKVEQLTVKDGLKLQLSAVHDHDTVVILGDLVGKHVSLVAADPAAHGGERAPATVDPDQPGLPVGEPGDSDLVDAADPPAEGEVARGLSIRDGDDSGGDETSADELVEA